MLKPGRQALIAASLVALAGTAGAQPAYSPDDIVSFFAASTGLGAARGLCIGTESECRDARTAPEGFDMLVSFELDSAVLTEEARRNLEKFAVALKDRRLSAERFVVEGHSDASGGASYNLSLSQLRAEAVRRFLLERGVLPERLRVIGLGESEPRTSDPYDPANRRVEMKIRLE